MVEIARLLLELDSTGAERGARATEKALDGTAAAADRAVTAVDRVPRAMKAATSAASDYNFATLGAADASSAVAREASKAAQAIESVGHGGEYARHIIKGLAAETLGLHGHVLNLVLGLNNVGDALGALGAFATSPLALIGSSVFAGVQILKEFERNLDRTEERRKAITDADARASQLQGLLNRVQSPTLEGLGVSINTGSLFPSDEQLTERMRRAIGGLRSGLSDEIQKSFNQSLDPNQIVTPEALNAIRERFATVLRGLPEQSALVGEQIVDQLSSALKKSPAIASPELVDLLEEQGGAALARATAMHKALDDAAEAAKRDATETTAFFRAQAQGAAAAKAQLDAQIASMNRAAQFADQGADAIERATRVQNLYDLALKASGGDTGLAGDRFREGLKAMEAEEAARRRAKDIAEEEAEILRGNAKLAQEMAADEERRQQRQEAARASAQAEISALSRRSTGLGAIPDTLGGFESARREQDIQSKLAAYRAKIADLPFDEQESAAARYEATLRDVVERETAWTDQEKLLKDELEQSKKAIEEHQKRVEDLAHAYADPLGKGLDDLFGKLQDGELSWRSFAETALNAMKEISAGVFHELVTRPFTESIVNTLTGRSGNGGGGGGFYGGSGGGGFGAGDSFGGGGAENVGTGRSAGIFSSALGGGLSAGLGKILPGLFGRRSEEPPIPLDAMLAYARAQSGTPSFDASDRLYFGGGGRLPWDDSSATAQPTSGIIDPKSTPGGTGGFGFDLFNLLGLGTQSWLQNPGSFFLGGGGGFGFGFERGAAFSRGRVIPFYRGDVFDNPTTFPMAGGDTGLLGERGPEAILPLSRGSDGRLGVRASGARGGSGDERDRSGGGTTVINNWKITTPNADSFRKSRRHMDQDEKRRASRG